MVQFLKKYISNLDRNWFYIVTLIIIMLMNLANGIYQNSIYGIVADFPDNYVRLIKFKRLFLNRDLDQFSCNWKQSVRSFH